MFRFITALTLAAVMAACGGSTPDANETDASPAWEDALRSGGLTAAEDLLAGANTDTALDFALGGIQFLRATEAIMQVRYRHSEAQLALVPGMRNALPYNPDATFDPAFLEIAMTEALTHLARAETTLAGIGGEDFAIEIPVDAIWFDINADGTRQDWESLLDMMGGLGAQPAEEFDGVIRFDSADAHWLKAYVHVMSGMAELTLAVDPTSAIRTVAEGRYAMDQLGNIQGMFLENDDIDSIAAVLLTLRGVPDAERTRAAHMHFRRMIDENKAFWTAVMSETDNDREWLPNPNQTSAFGVEVTQEMADGWQEVLAEMSGFLEGDLLVPYWRFNNGWRAETGVGINIAKFLQEPGDMDVILWLHGAGAVPYLENGKLARGDAWDRFSQMTRGDGLILAAWFN